MKERYQQLADRFAKLARRERLVVIVGGAAAVLVIGYTVAEGRLSRHIKLQKQLVQVTTETATAQAQIADLTKQLAEDPNAAFRTRIDDIRQEINRIDAEV
ncbi:MAG: type II secretion system protein GspM, partial [Burkholderiales bacterium]